MFNPCRHIRKIEHLATDKTTLETTFLLSGSILQEFKCKKCGKIVASVVRAT